MRAHVCRSQATRLGPYNTKCASVSALRKSMTQITLSHFAAEPACGPKEHANWLITAAQHIPHYNRPSERTAPLVRRRAARHAPGGPINPHESDKLGNHLAFTGLRAASPPRAELTFRERWWGLYDVQQHLPIVHCHKPRNGLNPGRATSATGFSSLGGALVRVYTTVHRAVSNSQSTQLTHKTMPAPEHRKPRHTSQES